MLPTNRHGLACKLGQLGRCLVAGVCLWAWPSLVGQVPSSREGTLTQHDVLPILLRRCAACHGRLDPEAGLDVRSRSSLVRGGKSGAAIVPGQPDESLLVKRIRAGEMPPRTRLVEACVQPIEPAEGRTIERWIALGAPEIAIEPDAPSTEPDPLVTAQDRDFWSFRPPRAMPSPQVRSAALACNPVDAFLLARLEPRGLDFSPEADRITLLRRVTFALTGLPPEASEIDSFASDADPLAYEKLVDRLLASPRHGEHWGRYWLDLAGYADSEGKREQDLFRPHAFRYRDYVIRAFNADKPYDRFLLEQIAGDDLAPHDANAPLSEEVHDNLVATGFLRLAPDATWANITGFLSDRIEVIADEMQVLGTAVLGLTIQCARCHDHKLEPIPQRDYYRFLDIFKGAFDEHDWLKPEIKPGIGPVSTDRQGGRLLPQVEAAERRAWEATQAAIEKELTLLRGQPPSAERDARLRQVEARQTPPPRLHALWDRGDPSPTYIYVRGDPAQPGRLVGPGVPSILSDGMTPFNAQAPWPGATSTGRRLELARWLTRPGQPLTARVMVNRLWLHHFGAGIVTTPENFGKSGAAPSHPELLDWLAVELERQNWSLKAIHRLLVTSRAYRQLSHVESEHERLDPDNRLLARMQLRRLQAEEVHDAMVVFSGVFDGSMYGPAAPITAREDGLVVPATRPEGFRRSVYVRQERKRPLTILEEFDRPAMNPNCISRRSSTVATQALHLLNNAWVGERSRQLALRVEKETGKNAMDQLEAAYRMVLGRPPGSDERSAALELVETVNATWSASEALAACCHALINSAAFLYVD